MDTVEHSLQEIIKLTWNALKVYNKGNNLAVAYALANIINKLEATRQHLCKNVQENPKL